MEVYSDYHVTNPGQPVPQRCNSSVSLIRNSIVVVNSIKMFIFFSIKFSDAFACGDGGWAGVDQVG